MTPPEKHTPEPNGDFTEGLGGSPGASSAADDSGSLDARASAGDPLEAPDEGVEAADLGADLEEQLLRDPDNLYILLQVARYHHRLAMQGDDEAFEKAESAVRNLLERDKHHVEALSILGSLFTILARRSGSMLKRGWYSFRAARTLDKAVKIDPDDISARTIRAFTSLVLPRFLKRLKTAVEDFEFLIDVKREHPEKLPDQMMPKVFFNLGLAYARLGEHERARDILEGVVAEYPGTREHNRAKSLIERLRLS